MDDERLFDLYQEIGRVVVPAALLEQSLATLAYAALGGDEAAHATTHALPRRSCVVYRAQAQARGANGGTVPALDLLARAEDPLEARHRVVHGYWTDIQGVVEGRSFITFKPDRKTKSWQLSTSIFHNCDNSRSI